MTFDLNTARQNLELTFVEDIRRIRFIAKCLEERVEFAKLARPDMKSTRDAIRSLKGNSSVGKKVLSAGLILTLAFPDPFTDIMGIPMIALGALLTRRSTLGVKDVRDTLSSLIRELKEFKALTG